MFFPSRKINFAYIKHSTALCSGISKTRLRKNPNGFSHGIKSQQRSRTFGNRTLTTSEMLNPYSTWPGLAQVYRLERQFQWWRSGHCYRTSNQVEFGITSLPRMNTTPLVS